MGRTGLYQMPKYLSESSWSILIEWDEWEKY